MDFAKSDIFCIDPKQQRKLEEDYLLRITKSDCGFYEDQKGARIAKFSLVIEAPNQSDELFVQRLKGRDAVATTFHYLSEAQMSALYLFDLHLNVNRIMIQLLQLA